MAEVFNSHDTTIGLSKLLDKQESYTLTSTGNIDIDNKGNREVLPTIKVTANATTTINSISNGNKIITFSLSDLVVDDVLTLDFENQKYDLNGTNIINNISLDGLLKLNKNENTILTFDFIGDIDIVLEYEQYQQEEILHYVQQFNFKKNKSYKESKPYNSNKTINKKLTDVSYNISINKMSLGFIDDENEFRIGFEMFNEDTLQNEYKYMIGVTFDSYDLGFNNPNEIIKDNLSGMGMDLITKK